MMVRGIAACALGSFFLTLPLADSSAAAAAEVAFGITSATAFSLPHYTRFLDESFLAQASRQ